MAAKSLAPIKRRSHVAVWKWVQKYADCADRYRTDRRLVSTIFVDETLLQIDGHDYSTGCGLHMNHLQSIRVWPCTSHVTEPFSCATGSSSSCKGGRGRKPIFTDGARWYNEACRWLRLPHLVYGTELKNLMVEQFIQQVKDDRTQNVSTTIFHVEKRQIATGGMCGTGSGCSSYICTWEQTGCGSHYFWLGMEVKLTGPFPIVKILYT
ncbi:putative transposase [Candidatus Nitrososphaera gargensis Ga9.2]|uniref:Putative transposase n=1 Tax=Nitrososphaera gargensis (strain Ga9.2) TaxID=1237085 RepID=K0IGB1_NITGG|nr:putative transposase [Candidatus Nitrososphaera gargensis Ga9.2]